MREECKNSQRLNRLFVALLALTLVLSAASVKVVAQEEAKEPAAAAGGRVPLKVDLPKPMYVGTPTDIKVENLEKPTTRKRRPLMVPEGTENVALNKPITSSDEAPIIGKLKQITDGDKKGSDGSYVELGIGKQWVQVDLKEKCKIYGIFLWHYHEQARVYHDVVVQVADDPDFIKNVRTVFNNDHDNSSGLGVGKQKNYIEGYEGRQIAVRGVVGRYVRFYSNGNTANDCNHYIETEVYGIPVSKLGDEAAVEGDDAPVEDEPAEEEGAEEEAVGENP